MNSEKLGPIFFNHQWNHERIMASNLHPVDVFSILQSNRIFYHIYTLTMVIHKSRNLIGTGGIAKFGLNRAKFFRVIPSLFCLKRHNQVK